MEGAWQEYEKMLGLHGNQWLPVVSHDDTLHEYHPLYF